MVGYGTGYYQPYINFLIKIHILTFFCYLLSASLIRKNVLQWALMTLLDPAQSLANLIYLGYSSDPASALRVTRRRSLDRKKKQSERNVFKCLVFGPKRAGKSALLNSFLGRLSF